MDPKIVVNISKKAVVKIEAFGYQGPICMKMLEPIQNALGVTSTVEPKAEFYAEAGEQAYVTQ